MPDDYSYQQTQDEVKPFAENRLSSKTQQLHELVAALVNSYQGVSRATAHPMLLGGRDLKQFDIWLTAAHSYFRDSTNRDLTLTSASEWVLDNYYIIRQALLQIGEDLPPGYYRQLPKLEEESLKGFPRIYAIGRSALSFQNYLLNVIDLQAILVEVQDHIPLTMGELWALPIFLRYALIEMLAHELVTIINPQSPPDLPVLPPHLSGIGESLSANPTVSDELLASGIIANVILSLRTISEQDWNDFFESVSRLEQTLRGESAGIYPLMDFKTRDIYRKEIEKISFASHCEENKLAETTVVLASELKQGDHQPSGAAPANRVVEDSLSNQPTHVGYYLFGEGRPVLEQKIGYHPGGKIGFERWGLRYADRIYLGSIFLLSFLFLGFVLFEIQRVGSFSANPGLNWIAALVLLIASFPAAVSISTSLINWLITLRVKPRILPKLNFKDGVPEEFKTLVVIPALINSHAEADSLVHQLEMHFLRNPESGLLFALLTDFHDADSETLPEDEGLVSYAMSAIEQLNVKYNRPNTVGSCTPLFYLLHRKRLWNKSEGRWMGWERKRGKLHELNRLLRGDRELSFSNITGGSALSEGLQGVQFVITLDADTILPRGTARRLAGTMAHPLNRARFDPTNGRVISGYTVLQPRMEIHPRSANLSWFTRIFAGDSGLDLYTLAVSDVYQDLFGEGSYVGKGIYDVDSFERGVKDRIPENTVLSHDLLEGIMGRAGLVTDITLIEDYPPNYFVQIKRQQRWIRGDWQLFPWLVQPGRYKLKFSAIDRWKMIDNLLRALLAPALLMIFGLGILFVPALTWFWVTVLLVSLGIPLLTSLTHSTLKTLGGENFGSAFHPLRMGLYRWCLAVVFLPYEAYNALDAILTTLYRLLISHKGLLEWTTAAQSAHLFGLETHRSSAWLKLIASTLLALAMVVVIQLVYMLTGVGVAPSLAFTIPILLLWAVSPLVAQWINRPIKLRIIPLTEGQASLFRQVARRTWGFFERFVGPEDHWLPPDHFQEEPVGITAHHTSPSNIGLLLTSTLAAYDFGYLDQLGLATRLSITMDTLDGLEKFRGHFLNWYDTLTLQPLQPRYISTVDSGNLAASLIVMTQACLTMPAESIFRWNLWQGYLDTLSNLTETLSRMHRPEFDRQVEEINHRIKDMTDQILAGREAPQGWSALFETVSGSFWEDLSKRLVELVTVGRTAFDLDALRKLQEVAGELDRHHQAIQRMLTELIPWIVLLEKVPEIHEPPEFPQALSDLRSILSYNPSLGQVHAMTEAGLIATAKIRDQLIAARSTPASGTEPDSKVLVWLDALDATLAQSRTNTDQLLEKFAQIAINAERYVKEMDFQFLYSPQRRVFHLGFNLDAGQLDNNYYDLLASEARIASIIALAKGEAPQSHWLQLGRPITRVDGSYVLLSWSATMFEYLMPPLFLRSYPGTLLSDSAEGAVLHQIAYAKSKNVPWGISESGFFRFDANQNYQYRAFGVPGLGFKRGLGDDLVIAPYASLMAINYDPQAVAENLVKLIGQDNLGLYGLYEAIDYTTDRLPVGSTSMVVHEYMAHHQGMIMMALVNYFHNEIMVKRMHSDPRIQSVDLLLQEQIPLSVPLQNPYAVDVKGVLRLSAAPVEINPWSVPVQTAVPQVDLLSNGDYSVLLSNMGGGYSTWRGIDLTRWQADGVLDPWGTWIYIQDLDLMQVGNSGKKGLWSAGFQPVPGDPNATQVTYFAHMAVFRRTENDVTSTMEVTVYPDDPVEIRRVHLHNTHDQPHHLRLTSYGEVILTQQVGDTRHPAFNKLFIESEFIPEFNLQLFTRRPRSSEEKPVFLGHMLVVENKGEFHDGQPPARHEADRGRFIGRGQTLRNPAALSSTDYLSGSSGATLDPIFALGQAVTLQPHESIEIAYITLAGDSREAILALAGRFSAWSLIERSFHQANIAAQTWLGKQSYDSQAFKNTLQVLSAMVYPFKAVRGAPETIAANRLGQSGLWRFGISGDNPIILIELNNFKQIDLVREILQIHNFLHTRRYLVDVVILNCQKTEYGAELNGMLYRLVSRVNSEQWLNQRGGIFILYADQINSDELILLHTVSRFLFNGERGSLNDQMPEYPIQVHHLPEFIPTRAIEAEMNPVEADPLPQTGPLQYFNGFGGFSQDGCSYVIDILPGNPTPAPWVNVIGYPNFGFMVSETGSQCTWAVNSGENRLTPWSNDPVRDPTGEALYLRDEETGDVWTPTPLPAGADQPYRVTHSAGLTVFEHHSHGLRQRLTLFASPEDPVKIIHLQVENTWNHTRRITATQYVEWVLGAFHADSMPYIIPEYDADEACLMATNPYSAEFGQRTAFLIASKPLHGLTADRTEFLGRGGSFAFPAALRRIGLETRLTAGEDPCGVLQLHLDLLPGTTEEIYFVLGQGSNKEQALLLAKKYHEPAYIGAALERTHIFWERLLGTIQVRTPEPAMDLILNRWMLYQSLSCRIWGRSAFYQPSGAFGFRDQLQDVLALLPIDPGIARGQILNAAQRQFTEGDVLHWWHLPSGRGVRTRISDDLLWLPYVAAMYVETTGDSSILEEIIPYLDAPPLGKDEDERYNVYPLAKEAGSMIDHCRRAIEKGSTHGPHRLPLIGSGDWNDGLNRVGNGGSGESVWLAWFLCDVLDRFAKICDDRGDGETAQNYRARAKDYAAAIEKGAWDGAWYRRAYYDDGSPLGSIQDPECQIDAIAQSWAVLSRVGDPVRSQQAMQAVKERLVRPEERLSLLFTPPFDKIDHDPGYIKGYLPGTRENGGQYTHAAVWTAWAFAQLGDGKQAEELFSMLNPILKADSPEKAAVYRVEPYIIAADIYSTPPYLRRGGWTWYTGSAAWTYRFGLAGLLGFKKIGASLKIDPTIPPDWDGYEITYTYGKACYQINVTNPGHIARGIQTIKLDGEVLPDGIIPLADEGKNHVVDVIMGKSEGV